MNEYEKLEVLAQVQCTVEEAAAAMDISPATFKKRLNADPKMKEIWDRGAPKGRVSLRRLQWQHARGFGPHAVAMTVHLSKHWLGEHDKQNLDINANININANRTATDIMLDNIKTELLSKEETIELAELCDLVDESNLASLTTSQRIRFFSLVNKGSPTVEEEAEQAPALLALPMPKAE